MEELWWTLAPVVEVIWVILLSIYILLERRSPQATLAWIFGLGLLPFIGIPIYIFFGPRRFSRRKRRRAAAQEAVQRLSVSDRPLERDLSLQAKNLMTMCENAVGVSALPRSADARLFLDGAAKYEALLGDVAAAKHHIHLEYYIWEPDGIGTRLRDQLTERARAGVEVRVLVDGFGSSDATDRFWRPLRDAGADVRRFNALTVQRWRPRMANFRTHRKIAVIDGRIGYTGGMNVSDVHTSEHSGEAAWRDTHVRLEGAAARGLQLVFCEDWYYAADTAPEGPAYLPEDDPDRAGEHVVQIVSSGPDENLNAIHKLFFSSIAGAHTRVDLTTPYFVPDEAILHALTTASLRGAEVRVLVPASGDVPLVAAASRSYYPELLKNGVRIFEYGPPVLHAKTLVVDDDLAVVGTANTDNRSFRLNFEVAAAAYHPAACDQLSAAFEADLEKATEVTMEVLHKLPFRQRLFSAAARLLSPVL